MKLWGKFKKVLNLPPWFDVDISTTNVKRTQIEIKLVTKKNQQKRKLLYKKSTVKKGGYF